MDSVMDLAARATGFITIIQDKLQEPDSGWKKETHGIRILDGGIDDIVSILQKPLQSPPQPRTDLNRPVSGSKLPEPGEIPATVQRRNEGFRRKVNELVLPDEDGGLTVPEKFLAEARALLGWLQANKTDLKEKIGAFQHFEKGEEGFLSAKEGDIHYGSFLPPPYLWRDAIRSLLHAEPANRQALALALEYVPLQVVLALGGCEGSAREQRMWQGQWLRPDSSYRKAVLNLIADDNALTQGLLDNEVPLAFENILKKELAEIAESRTRRKVSAAGIPCHDAFEMGAKMKLSGLAFSGGGIRSATFNLGILQGLAQAGMLNKFDYLSTVSGGGYIGSWLVAWIKRTGSVFKVTDRLNSEKSKDPRGEEVRPVRWLRMFSNYLAPNASIMSADSWTIGLTWLRNTLINQLIVLLIFCSLICLSFHLFYLWNGLTWTMAPTWGKIFGVSALLFLIPAVFGGWGMHSYSRNLWPPSPLKPKFTIFVVLFLLAGGSVAAFLVSGWLFSLDYTVVCDEPQSTFEGRVQFILPVAFAGFLGLMVLSILGRYDACWPRTGAWRRIRSYLIFLFSSAIAAFAGLFLLAWAWMLLEHTGNLAVHPPPLAFESLAGPLANVKPHYFYKGLAYTIGPPLVVEVLGLTVVIRMALMGDLFPDERREWWGRMGAEIHRLILVWLLLNGIALVGGQVAVAVLRDPDTFSWAISVAGGWSAVIGMAVKLAFSSNTPASPNFTGSVSKWRDYFVRFAPYLFGLGALLISATIVFQTLEYLKLRYFFSFTTAFLIDFFRAYSINERHIIFTLLLTTVLSLATLVLVWRVGVNEFSMHHFYRNRLARAYLGATRRRTERIETSNSFTGFDLEDDLKLATLCTREDYYGPYLIINTTLNASQSTELDRRDRKAESFVFTPLFCGFDFSRTRSAVSSAEKTYEYGFRPTAEYAYADDSGPGLSTAMAISGAAANPNQGFHSSAATAFLLTLFNVRLGWWIGNPRRKTWKKADPGLGLAYLISDMIGKTDTRNKFVCLSDGGHFDNMGLYELIRRRCRLIVLGDGEQDGEFTCEGLANAIRRCRIDFGVEIEIEVTPITDRDPEKKLSDRSFAVGKIWYPDDAKGEPSGTLIYLKSSITGNEPVDVREYAIANPDFPHQSTGDQFFNESQFESYRQLGLHIAEQALTEAKPFQDFGG